MEAEAGGQLGPDLIGSSGHLAVIDISQRRIGRERHGADACSIARTAISGEQL
jgi:hypothetical protein